MMKKTLLTILMAATTAGASAQRLAVNTDMAMDLLMTPSLGVEMTVGERSTLGLNLLGNHKPWGQTMKMFGVQPEYRYYFSGRPMHSLFAGIGGVAAFYDITRKGKVYDGIAYGGGITFGYVFKLAHRVNIDCHAGFAVVGYNRKEYYVGDNYNTDYIVEGVNKTNAHGYYLMPSRIGVSVTYILK